MQAFGAYSLALSVSLSLYSHVYVYKHTNTHACSAHTCTRMHVTIYDYTHTLVYVKQSSSPRTWVWFSKTIPEWSHTHSLRVALSAQAIDLLFHH